MSSSDRERGKLILIITSIIFLYYTIWIIGSPFIDDERLQSFFYPQHLALLIPAICGLCFIGGLVIFTLYHNGEKFKASYKSICKELIMSSKQWLIIGISGVTCSGKSTLAKELHKNLNRSVILHQDDYFLPPDDPRHIKIPELNHNNWEILSSIDMHKMYLDILKIIECRPVEDKSHNKCKHVLILDGFLLFGYKPISDICNVKYFLTLTKEQCWERRKARTYNPPDVPGYFDKIVWPEYLNHLSKITKDEHAYTKITFIDGSVDKELIFQMVFTKVQELLS